MIWVYWRPETMPNLIRDEFHLGRQMLGLLDVWDKNDHVKSRAKGAKDGACFIFDQIRRLANGLGI
jgi:hypothetical protein